MQDCKLKPGENMLCTEIFSDMQKEELLAKIYLYRDGVKDVHVVVQFAYLLLSYSKFELMLLRAC